MGTHYNYFGKGIFLLSFHLLVLFPPDVSSYGQGRHGCTEAGPGVFLTPAANGELGGSWLTLSDFLCFSLYNKPILTPSSKLLTT